MSRKGIVRDCQHPRARHEHGTMIAYTLDGCRCEPCSTAKSRWNKRHKHEVATGRYQGLVDAAPVRLHLLSLSTMNIGRRNIVAQSGISHQAVTAIMDGTRRRVRPETAGRLLAITGAALPTTAVDATGTRRRLQALVALGWAPIELARRLGMETETASKLLHRGRVLLRTEQAVRALYEELWNQPPRHDTGQHKRNYQRALAMAARYGWPLPLAWDDDEIDDPDAQPGQGEAVTVDEVKVMLATGGDPRVELTRPEAIEAVRRLNAAGLTDGEIGIRLHRSVDAILKIRHRHLPETIRRAS
jgi:hypothetical protein